MAFALTGSVVESSTGSATHDATLTIASGDTKIIVLAGGDIATKQPSTCTLDPGGANEAAFTALTLRQTTRIFYLDAADIPAAGDYTVRVVFTGGISTSAGGFWAQCTTGLAQGAPEDDDGRYTGSNETSSSLTLTTTSGAFVPDVIAVAFANTPTKGADQSLGTGAHNIDVGTGGVRLAWSYETGDGENVMSWTFGSDTVAHAAASFALVAGGSEHALVASVSAAGTAEATLYRVAEVDFGGVDAAASATITGLQVVKSVAATAGCASAASVSMSVVRALNATVDCVAATTSAGGPWEVVVTGTSTAAAAISTKFTFSASVEIETEVEVDVELGESADEAPVGKYAAEHRRAYAQVAKAGR